MDRPSPRKRNYKIRGRNIFPPPLPKKNMTMHFMHRIFVKENEMSISIDLELTLKNFLPPPPPPPHIDVPTPLI